MRAALLTTSLVASSCGFELSGAAIGRHASVRATTACLLIEPAPPAGFVWATLDDAPAPSVLPVAPVAPEKLVVLSDADAVGAAIRERVEAAAAKAIGARGHFALAIPGGSVLKMLGGTAPTWASKCTLAYVNHKAVSMDDTALATHAKATSGFLGAWDGVDAIVMGGSADAHAEAAAYEAALRALPENVLPRDSSGLPVFDLMLIGVGDDGHVGSLYPGRAEVADESGAWVLPVEMKSPGSITLSLPVMAAAADVVIAACGVSEKYPQGKSAAMARGIEGDETPDTFPAVGLRPVATWVVDEAAASKLSSDYE